MYKLVSEVGRWAVKDNSMIFCNVVWMSRKEDAYKYHLVDDELNDIDFNVNECIEEC